MSAVVQREGHLKSICIDLTACPRCGQDHPAISMQKFHRSVSIRGETFNFWAVCPVNGDPIIYAHRPGVGYQSPAKVTIGEK